MAKKKTIEPLQTKELESSLPASLQINQKDINEISAICKKINMGLEDYLLAIKNALNATKTTIDKYGEEHIEDDHDKRLKAAMMGLEVQGYIRSKEIANDNSKHTHVTYQWMNAPNINIIPGNEECLPRQ